MAEGGRDAEVREERTWHEKVWAVLVGEVLSLDGEVSSLGGT